MKEQQSTEFSRQYHVKLEYSSLRLGLALPLPFGAFALFWKMHLGLKRRHVCVGKV